MCASSSVPIFSTFRWIIQTEKVNVRLPIQTIERLAEVLSDPNASVGDLFRVLEWQSAGDLIYVKDTERRGSNLAVVDPAAPHLASNGRGRRGFMTKLLQPSTVSLRQIVGIWHPRVVIPAKAGIVSHSDLRSDSANHRTADSCSSQDSSGRILNSSATFIWRQLLSTG